MCYCINMITDQAPSTIPTSTMPWPSPTLPSAGGPVLCDTVVGGTGRPSANEVHDTLATLRLADSARWAECERLARDIGEVL